MRVTVLAASMAMCLINRPWQRRAWRYRPGGRRRTLRRRSRCGEDVRGEVLGRAAHDRNPGGDAEPADVVGAVGLPEHAVHVVGEVEEPGTPGPGARGSRPPPRRSRARGSPPR